MSGRQNNVNLVVVRGVLSRPPEERVLPSGSVVVGYDVTVGRSTGPAESVPVVWPDPPSRRSALDEGDAVVVIGRVRRRFFRASGSTQSRTEVVADQVLSTRASRRVHAAVQRAIDAALAEVPVSPSRG